MGEFTQLSQFLALLASSSSSSFVKYTDMDAQAAIPSSIVYFSGNSLFLLRACLILPATFFSFPASISRKQTRNYKTVLQISVSEFTEEYQFRDVRMYPSKEIDIFPIRFSASYWYLPRLPLKLLWEVLYGMVFKRNKPNIERHISFTSNTVYVY